MNEIEKAYLMETICMMDHDDDDLARATQLRELLYAVRERLVVLYYGQVGMDDVGHTKD